MKYGFITLVVLLCQTALAESNVLDHLKLTVADKPFLSNWESLTNYQCPDWFRDAKFGIWAVWGPESVPMQGDWYARRIYQADCVDKAGKPVGPDPANKFHVEHYGHPSKVGFKDIIPLWKAEQWEPDRLMALYKNAGAKYFCMIAMHHDNFDCWNSKYQPKWNSVNMGPQRDIAAEWQQAAKKQGLRFGMTEHLAASWWFYSVNKGADKTGLMAGVPYDGNDPQFADLYWSGNAKPDFHYYGTNVPFAYKTNWFNRIKDMVDRYHPDLLYSDSPLPYPDEVGRQLLAHYYNDNLQQHGGKLEAVYNCKEDSQGRWVQDFERGVMDGINPHPWQTDTCVGNWYYKTGCKYKSSTTVIQMLVDIVSKNGNLLLNLPLRPEGTLDEQEEKILADLAAWMPVNSEAIFGTRPWKVFGEGPSNATNSGSFNEGKLRYTAQDIRFTTKGEKLYAILLGWPAAGQVTIKSLAEHSPNWAGKIGEVKLLGSPEKLLWTREADGLHITLAKHKPCDSAYALQISP